MIKPYFFILSKNALSSIKLDDHNLEDSVNSTNVFLNLVARKTFLCRR